MSVLGKLEKTRESHSPLRDIGRQHRVCLSISTGPRKVEMLLFFRKRSEEGVCVVPFFSCGSSVPASEASGSVALLRVFPSLI